MRSVEKMKKEIIEFEKLIESRRTSIRCQQEFMKLYPNIPTEGIYKTIAGYEDEIRRSESHIEKLKACIDKVEKKNENEKGD